MKKLFCGVLSFSMLAPPILLAIMLFGPGVGIGACVVFLVSAVWICLRPVLMAKILAGAVLVLSVLMIAEHRYLAKWIHSSVSDPEFIQYEQEQDRLERHQTVP
jgi:hypothetical protein